MGETLLARACRRRDLFQVQALLRDRADPNERDAQGETALLQAAAQGDLDVVALLLSHGALPQQRAPRERLAEVELQRLGMAMGARASPEAQPPGAEAL